MLIDSTGSTHLLSAILTKATGSSTLEFGRKHLADPLGISLPEWMRDPQGIYFGGNEMLLTQRGRSRFNSRFSWLPLPQPPPRGARARPDPPRRP